MPGFRLTLFADNHILPHSLLKGYSIENYCPKSVPHSYRRDSAYVLAKVPGYFTSSNFPYTPNVFRHIRMDHPKIRFIAGSGKRGEKLPVEGIDNIGQLPSRLFEAQLAMSKALVSEGMSRCEGSSEGGSDGC